jgi:predicted dehydrogenase
VRLRGRRRREEAAVQAEALAAEAGAAEAEAARPQASDAAAARAAEAPTAESQVRDRSGSGRQRLRAAVIGTGFVGPHHVDGIRRAGYADVVVLGGTDAARTQARARELDIPHATTDIDALLADPDIDVVHICTPNVSHVPLARAALEAGRHVVVEKPLALSSAEADELVALAQRLGRHAAVAFTYRGYPMVRRARQIVVDGELGDVRLVHGAYLQDWLVEPTSFNWRLASELGGASRAVADIGSHWFDTAEFISGRRIEAVQADLATFMPVRRRPAAAGIAFSTAQGPAEEVPVYSEDAATILVRFRGGARGAAVISQISPGRKNAFTLEIDGSRGALAWAQETPETIWIGSHLPDGSRVLQRTPGAAPIMGVPSLPAGHPEGWGDAWRDLLRPFYRAVAEGAPTPAAAPTPDSGEVGAYPTLRDGARAVRFVEAVLASSRSGSWALMAG